MDWGGPGGIQMCRLGSELDWPRRRLRQIWTLLGESWGVPLLPQVLSVFALLI